ncbi:MAG TPA: AraC family transcriptional regulator, partial [Burkholderiaceae bacterium]|nr:AraC family transcriptional regulator [Burkholderiaceae bacterium]
GVAASTLAASGGFSGWPSLPRAALAAVAAGSMFTFWLFTRALLSDSFALRGWHAAVWFAHAALGIVHCFATPGRPVVGLLMGLLPVLWAALAIAQSLTSWREDLVEGRRRLRGVIVVATAGYTIAQLLAALLTGWELRAIIASTANAAGTAVLVVCFAWQLLQWRGNALFDDVAADGNAEHGPAVAARAGPATPRLAPADPPDARQVATLEALMTAQHVYREPSLTIAALALRMGLPEHRLRRLINQGLGHRHFSAFLNAYRIADAKRALRDPAQADVPVLTIAMDAGFQSIGPFNRAFKAETGLTPTEFRRQQSTDESAPATPSEPSESPMVRTG